MSWRDVRAAGVMETSLYINGLPVCLDCDNETLRPHDSPWNQRLNPPKKVQSIEDSKSDAPTIHIVRPKGR